MYTKVYKEFLGADVSSERSEVDDNRFAHLINMWRDYRSQDGVAVETAVGFDQLGKLDGHIYGIHYLPANETHGGKFIIHSGNTLYSYDPLLDWVKDVNPKKVYFDTHITGSVGNARSSAVAYYNALYYVDGSAYLKIVNGDPVKAYDAKSTGYIPTTYRNGTAYEQRNLLYDKVREEYDADGETKVFFLHDHAMRPKIVLDGVRQSTLMYTAPITDSGNEFAQITYEGYNNKRIYPIANPSAVPFGFDAEGVSIYVGYMVTTVAGGENDVVTKTPILYEEYIASPTGTVTHTLVKGAEGWDFTYSKGDDGRPIVESFTAPNVKAGTTIEIVSDVVPNKFSTVGDMRDILTGNPDMVGRDSALEAINGCTLITEFDDRIFLSGNPALPNTVFYSQRDSTGLNNPFYIGAYNYLNDGTDGTPITGMISSATMLIVLKGDSPQGSNLYYHQGVNNDTEDKVIADLQPRLYPRTSGVAGEGCTGVAVNFLDDACFVSRKGLEAVGREAVNLERTLTHRSVYVDSLLRDEDLYNMAYAEWDGYLCLLAPSGRMYLADGRKRTSHKHYGYQYEWFIWDGIGVWEGQTDRYFYVNDGAGGKAGEYDIAVREGYAEGEVTTIESKKYIIADGYAFPVDTDGEKHGGEFSPATCLLSVGGKLYFGCENGAVCVFNTDMVDGAIPAEKYTRNGRRYMAQISTKSDNCGAPYAEKTTERGTVVIKAKAFPSAKVRVMVRTDRDIWRQCDEVYLGVTDFGNMDFGTFKFGNVDETIAPVRENKRRWVEKQIGLEAECYKSPVGIINITYGYRITGKVRRR